MEQEYADLISVEELCEILRISRNAAYQLLSSGDLKCFRMGRIWKIPRQGVLDHIREQSFRNKKA